jgi:Phage terminase large subunit (GpA)
MHVLIGTPMDIRMKSSCSRSSNAREILGSRRAAALFLTAGADVQKDRIEVSIWAWGRFPGLDPGLAEDPILDRRSA